MPKKGNDGAFRDVGDRRQATKGSEDARPARKRGQRQASKSFSRQLHQGRRRSPRHGRTGRGRHEAHRRHLSFLGTGSASHDRLIREHQSFSSGASSWRNVTVQKKGPSPRGGPFFMPLGKTFASASGFRPRHVHRAGISSLTGMTTVKVEPVPSTLLRAMCPPKRSTNSFTPASPTPVPLISLARALDAR